MLERLLRTLLHPKLTMTAIAVLHMHTGITTVVYRPHTLAHPTLWGVVNLIAAVAAFASIKWIKTRWIVTAAGALLVGVAFSRGFALIDHLLDDNLTATTKVTAAISIAQWHTIGYLTFVIWRRLVIPFSVLEQTDRRAEPRC